MLSAYLAENLKEQSRSLQVFGHPLGTIPSRSFSSHHKHHACKPYSHTLNLYSAFSVALLPFIGSTSMVL